MIRFTFNPCRKGNAVVEYVLITALTALATVAIFKTFRADVTTAYKKAGEALVRGVDEGTSDGPTAP